MPVMLKAQIVKCPDGLEFDTGRRDQCSYRALLEQLLDSPKDSVLRFASLSKTSRYQINGAAKKLGVRLGYSDSGGATFVKIVEVLGPLKLRGNQVGSAEIKAADVATLSKDQRILLAALKNGPMTLRKLAGAVARGPLECAKVLSDLAARDLVETDDNCYRLKESK